MDKGKTLNKEFNKIYDLISDVHEKVDTFYCKYFFCNINADNTIKEQFTELIKRMDSVREQAHEIAEHFTWDN